MGMLHVTGKNVLHLDRIQKAVPFWKQWDLHYPLPTFPKVPLDRRERYANVGKYQSIFIQFSSRNIIYFLGEVF